jgi:hypothetical protein
LAGLADMRQEVERQRDLRAGRGDIDRPVERCGSQRVGADVAALDLPAGRVALARKLRAVLNW